MTDIGYDIEGLRRGAGEHRVCADAVDALAQVLAAIDAAPGPFGDVLSAGAFAGGIVAARDRQREEAVDESVRRGELQERADTTAGIGEHLVALTTAEAGSGPAPFPLFGGGG